MKLELTWRNFFKMSAAIFVATSAVDWSKLVHGNGNIVLNTLATHLLIAPMAASAALTVIGIAANSRAKHASILQPGAPNRTGVSSK